MWSKLRVTCQIFIKNTISVQNGTQRGRLNSQKFSIFGLNDQFLKSKSRDYHCDEFLSQNPFNIRFWNFYRKQLFWKLYFEVAKFRKITKIIFSMNIGIFQKSKNKPWQLFSWFWLWKWQFWPKNFNFRISVNSAQQKELW